MFKGSGGLTDSEKYLKWLCDKSFLSLWSHANVFRQSGSELCDLLVIFGDEIIIFSDKYCQFPDSGNLDQDWNRWFRRAVASSAKQLWGAENWIRNHPERIYLDNKCQHKLSVPIEITENTNFHLVLVSHGASNKCAQLSGGSGSLIFFNEIKGFDNHSFPFHIGDLDVNKTFIHVLDDNTLNILLNNRDTVADFSIYLKKRKKFLRSGITVFSAGEEELLAHYLKFLNIEGEHDFVLPNNLESDSAIAFDEGLWINFQGSSQRLAQLQADRKSYIWDDLIEEFSRHAIAGTQHYVSEGGFLDSEKAIRFLAQTTRLERRLLSNNLLDIIETTPSNMRRLRVIIPTNPDNIYYVLLLFPCYELKDKYSYEDYRESRRYFLQTCCMITRLKYPDANYVIGIAMESGYHFTKRSEDLICFDCNNWNEGLERSAREDQEQLGILVSPSRFEFNEKEYPD
ncbi:hypothetical protein [Persicitalea jodogahamensis]|uniref:Preprotein translocase SecA chain n=1 Tax=Persicitalea jodogahamensis TaxID=402147 RepID=A0A8J3G9W9_9BACT|nr:hypothetical protein [Persicitalea jodogahamensis]GHB78435.1 preprotein translocase SecA chain [Persicitalea jodogahamensis]